MKPFARISIVSSLSLAGACTRLWAVPVMLCGVLLFYHIQSSEKYDGGIQ